MPTVALREKSEERESVTLYNQGQKIFGILHLPLVTTPCPAIVMCHGLAGNKTGKMRQYVQLSSMLSALGIASLRIDFRGSGDSEGDFSEMTLESEISDTLVALDFLAQHPQINASRIGIFGRSAGGLVAVKAAARFKKIKSIALWAAIHNGDQWREKWKQAHSASITQEQRTNMMRFNGQVPSYEFFKQLFETQIVADLQTLAPLPLLNIHSKSDETVSIENAYRYKKQREHASGKSDFVVLDHSDHEFSHPQELLQTMNKTADWFGETL